MKPFGQMTSRRAPHGDEFREFRKSKKLSFSKPYSRDKFIEYAKIRQISIFSTCARGLPVCSTRSDGNI